MVGFYLHGGRGDVEPNESYRKFSQYYRRPVRKLKQKVNLPLGDRGVDGCRGQVLTRRDLGEDGVVRVNLSSRALDSGVEAV